MFKHCEYCAGPSLLILEQAILSEDITSLLRFDRFGISISANTDAAPKKTLKQVRIRRRTIFKLLGPLVQLKYNAGI